VYANNCIEGFSSDEAVQNVASLYNSGMATVTNLRATTGITADASITSPSFTSPGRLHLSGPELLYLLNKNGVIVGKEWGGNGNLNVQGDTTVNGGVTVGNYLYTKGNSTGGTHFPWTDGNNYITSNNNILRGGPTTIQGDLNISGRARFRTMNGVRVEDGWDMANFASADINSCANECSKRNTALSALFQRNNKHCWCKSTTRLYPNPDNNYDTVLFA